MFLGSKSIRVAVLGASAMAAFLGVISPASAGSVTILGQRREVAVVAEGPQGGRVSHSSTDGGLFNETASFEDVGTGYVSRASASMNSTIGSEGVSLTGSVSYAVQDNRGLEPSDDVSHIRATTALSFLMDFTVDAPVNYRLERFQSTTTADPKGNSDRLFEFSRDGFPYIDDILATNHNLNTGTLTPGTYRLRLDDDFDSVSSGPDLAAFQRDYSLSLTFSPVNDGGGANPVPLPPAAWSGLTVLGAGALVRLRKKRLA